MKNYKMKVTVEATYNPKNVHETKTFDVYAAFLDDGDVIIRPVGLMPVTHHISDINCESNDEEALLEKWAEDFWNSKTNTWKLVDTEITAED